MPNGVAAPGKGRARSVPASGRTSEAGSPGPTGASAVADTGSSATVATAKTAVRCTGRILARSAVRLADRLPPEHLPRQAVVRRKPHEASALLVPELQAQGVEAVADRHHRRIAEDRLLLMRGAQVIVRDLGAEVVD